MHAEADLLEPRCDGERRPVLGEDGITILYWTGGECRFARGEGGQKPAPQPPTTVTPDTPVTPDEPDTPVIPDDPPPVDPDEDDNGDGSSDDSNGDNSDERGKDKKKDKKKRRD
jgi:hypothetical protein